MRDLNVVWQDVSALTPYIRNSRTHSDEQVAQVAASIKEFGWTNPILIDEDHSIIAGHGRLQAAQRLSAEQVPTITLTGLTDAQKRAYVIADNKLALNAGWDEEMLAVEINDLLGEGFDLELTGFDQSEIDALLAEADKVDDGLTDEDAVPEVPAVPVSKLGDVWVLGRHRVMCGDSTSIDAVDRLMEKAKSDMVFTDPPYNIDYGNIKHPKFKQRDIKNDNMSASDFSQFCADFAHVIHVFCDGCIYVFSNPAEDGRLMFAELDKIFHCSTTIIWNKDVFTLGRGKYQNKYEPCWFGWNKTGSAFIDDRKLTNVWDFPRPKASKLHPTMKPVELIEHAICHASNAGGSVLDLFGGSGSTLIAAEKTGRNARLMELDEKYVDVIVKRWQEFTGKDAVHAESGQTFNEIDNVGIEENTGNSAEVSATY